MIFRGKDTDYQCALDDDLILDDIVLSNYDGSTELLENLVNMDCALALSVCKSRNLPSCVFVLSLLYMKRIRSLQSSSSLSIIDDLTTKELYLIATLLADKYLIDEGEDEQLFNSELSELTGISTKRINLIERQVLFALNWNLHIPNDEFRQFASLFKCQMIRKLNKNIEMDDPLKFYNQCFELLPQIIEYIALTSLLLLGSTLSILTAIHISTLTHSAVMKSFNPTLNSSYLNTSLIKQNFWTSQIDFTNETTDKHHSDLSPMTLFDISSCSINLLRPHEISRPFIQTLG